jgi:hypothetical protein
MSSFLTSLKSLFISFVLASLGWCVLLAPNSIAEPLGFTQIRTNHIVFKDVPARTIVGLATAVFSISTLVLLAIQIWTWQSRKARETGVLNSLQFLSMGERVLLAYCVRMRVQAVSLEVTHADAEALRAKGILIRGPVTNILAVPFIVNPIVWGRLIANPVLLFGDQAPDSPEVDAAIHSFERHLNRHRW